MIPAVRARASGSFRSGTKQSFEPAEIGAAGAILFDRASQVKVFPQKLEGGSDLLFPKFHSGLLHLAIRQKPDERFVVKIDNLDPVAPRIVKVAAKRRFEF